MWWGVGVNFTRNGPRRHVVRHDSWCADYNLCAWLVVHRHLSVSHQEVVDGPLQFEAFILLRWIFGSTIAISCRGDLSASSSFR